MQSRRTEEGVHVSILLINLTKINTYNKHKYREHFEIQISTSRNKICLIKKNKRFISI